MSKERRLRAKAAKSPRRRAWRAGPALLYWRGGGRVLSDLTPRQCRMVSQQLLMEGAVYALQHSGTLLHSAVTLHSVKEFSPAAVLALLGREELGKYHQLREVFERVGAGESISPKRLRKLLEDHKGKQRSAVLSVPWQRTDDESRILLDALMKTAPGNPEHQAAVRFFESVAEQSRAALPDARHRLRMQALYVDLKDDGTGWNRPEALDPNVVSREVLCAVNDYSTARYRLVAFEPPVPDSFRVLYRGWQDRPELPELTWPRVG